MHDEIRSLEQVAFLDYILAQEHLSSWTVAVRSLVRRSVVQGARPNLAQRSLAQLEAVVASVARAGSYRYDDDFFLGRPVPIFAMKLALAQLLERMSLCAAALAVYDELDIWEPRMTLLVRLGRRRLAEEMLRRRIDDEGEHAARTPRLFCILGDVTNDPSWYDRAWAVSGERYARAQRSLGERAFDRDRWQDAIDHFELALAINPIFPQTWFSLGYAALQIKSWPLMIRAFSRCVQLRPDDGEALNNLAAAYLETRQMPQAFEALKSCVRIKRDDWKVWDNFLTAAISIGDWQSALIAIDALCDLKLSQVDLKTVRAICDATISDRRSAGASQVAFLIGRVRDVLAKLGGMCQDGAELHRITWRFYAELDLDDETRQRASEFQGKYVHCLESARREWQDSQDRFAELVGAIEQWIADCGHTRPARLLVSRVLSVASKGSIEQDGNRPLLSLLSMGAQFEQDDADAKKASSRMELADVFGGCRREFI